MDSYEAGIRRVLDRRTNVFFGDRAILLDAAKRSPSDRDLIVLDRHFTHETMAFALPRGDEDFRLIVDSDLEPAVRIQGISRVCTRKWFGQPEREHTRIVPAETRLPRYERE